MRKMPDDLGDRLKYMESGSTDPEVSLTGLITRKRGRASVLIITSIINFP